MLTFKLFKEESLTTILLEHQVLQIKQMKQTHCLILLLAFLISVYSFAQTNNIPTDYKMVSHPRLFLLKGEEDKIRKEIASDPLKRKVHLAIMLRVDTMLNLPTVERVLEGKRLLGVSREFLNRIFFLAYAYRITSENKYAQRAEKEMLAVAAFSDWHPEHFLDVAEMTTGMAIGYDWLYDFLPQNFRSVIANSIISFGINPSLDKKYNNWLKATNNWNQVCNAGIALGALAVYENNPTLANEIVNRSLESIKVSMNEYAPNGAYQEGYGYWNYGTTYNVLFLDAIDRIFGKDFNLSKSQGFSETSSYLLNMTGPDGSCFNYSDCGTSKNEVSTAMYWFAKKENNNGLLYNQLKYLKQSSPKSLAKDRLLPTLLIWALGNDFGKVLPPTNNIWVGEGKTPVALMHTSWADSNAIFVGLKAGSPSTNHAHMDVGSFVLDAMGERWAMDLGGENYNKLETAGMDIWNGKQNGQRWQVYRYNNFTHNTLTVDDSLQRVNGYASITSYSRLPDSLSATTDITSLYKPSLQSAIRTVAILHKKKVIVKDQIMNTDKQTVIRWTLVTPAQIKIVNDHTIELLQHNKTLVMRLNYIGAATTFSKPAKPSRNYETDIKGVQLVGFDFSLNPNEKTNWEVSFEADNQ